MDGWMGGWMDGSGGRVGGWMDQGMAGRQVETC